MCTVTLIPLPRETKGFILTSNRDEAVERQTLAPAIYEEDGEKLLYPKDTLAGGTWIGVSDRKRAICLLNGGFKMHIPDPPYRKSRGAVVKDFLKSPDLAETLRSYPLPDIEPFTMVIVDWSGELQFLELVWDGKTRHLRELEHQPQLWSSASLYTPEIITARKQHFTEFLKQKRIDPEAILEFHNSEESTESDSFLIDRGFLKTVSITQITHLSEKLKLHYRDLASLKHSFSEFSFGNN